MTLIELHECDRCGDEIRVPKSTVYIVAIDKDDPEEFCMLCRDAMMQYREKGRVTKWPGVVEHEKKLIAKWDAIRKEIEAKT